MNRFLVNLETNSKETINTNDIPTGLFFYGEIKTNLTKLYTGVFVMVPYWNNDLETTTKQLVLAKDFGNGLSKNYRDWECTWDIPILIHNYLPMEFIVFN